MPDLGLQQLLTYTAFIVVGLCITQAYQRLFGTNYVPLEECKECRDNCKADNGDELTALRDEVKQLRNMIIKHLLLNTIPENAAARDELERLLNG